MLSESRTNFLGNQAWALWRRVGHDPPNAIRLVIGQEIQPWRWNELGPENQLIAYRDIYDRMMTRDQEERAIREDLPEYWTESRAMALSLPDLEICSPPEPDPEPSHRDGVRISQFDTRDLTRPAFPTEWQAYWYSILEIPRPYPYEPNGRFRP